MGFQTETVATHGSPDFEEYVSRLFEALDIEVRSGYTQDSGLYDDIGLDSLQAFELVIFTEELAGLTMPPPFIPMIFTLGDAYTYFLTSGQSVD